MAYIPKNAFGCKAVDIFGKPTGFVYFISQGEPCPEFVKIGYTAHNPHSRMRALQTGNPFPLKLMGYIHGRVDMEQEYHSVLSPFRCSGEWFKFDEYVQNFVDGMLSENLL